MPQQQWILARLAGIRVLSDRRDTAARDRPFALRTASSVAPDRTARPEHGVIGTVVSGWSDLRLEHDRAGRTLRSPARLVAPLVNRAWQARAACRRPVPRAEPGQPVLRSSLSN